MGVIDLSVASDISMPGCLTSAALTVLSLRKQANRIVLNQAGGKTMNDTNSDPVLKAGNVEEVWTNEHCYIHELMNAVEIPDVSLARTRVEPGVTTELHRLSVREWYVIAAGTGLMEVDRKPAVAVGPGDTVAIPAGVAQRITNTGTDDLVFQCVCLPRFTVDCYESLE